MWGQSLDAEKDTKPHTATERESAPGTEDSGSPSHPPAVFEGKPLFRALLPAVSSVGGTHLLVVPRRAAK